MIDNLTSSDISVLLCAISKARDYYAPDELFLHDLGVVEGKVRGAIITPKSSFNQGAARDLEF